MLMGLAMVLILGEWQVGRVTAAEFIYMYIYIMISHSYFRSANSVVSYVAGAMVTWLSQE